MLAGRRPGAAHPAVAVGLGQHRDPGDAEERHLPRVDDELTDAGLPRPRVQAEVQRKGGVGVHLADDLDDLTARPRVGTVVTDSRRPERGADR